MFNVYWLWWLMKRMIRGKVKKRIALMVKRRNKMTWKWISINSLKSYQLVQQSIFTGLHLLISSTRIMMMIQESKAKGKSLLLLQSLLSLASAALLHCFHHAEAWLTWITYIDAHFHPHLLSFTLSFPVYPGYHHSCHSSFTNTL